MLWRIYRVKIENHIVGKTFFKPYTYVWVFFLQVLIWPRFKEVHIVFTMSNIIILAISAGEEEAWARPGRSISPSIACFFQSQLSISIFNKIRACIALHSSPATTCTTTLTPTQRLTISTALCYCFCSSCLCLAWLWQEWTATAVVDVVALDKLQKIATFNCKAGRKCSSDSFCQRI